MTSPDYYTDPYVRLLQGDVLAVLATLEAGSVQCVVTSPPYFALRSYLDADHEDKGMELGSENSPDCLGWATGVRCGQCYICHMVQVFAGVWRVLRDDGTCWINIGDSYAGGKSGRSDYGNPSLDWRGGHLASDAHQTPIARKPAPGLKAKDLVLIPARLALALQASGWYVRSHIVWAKKAPMPESVNSRPTSAWESVWLLTKAAHYFYDSDAVREEGTRYEWNTQKFKGGDVTRHHGSTQGRENGDPNAGRNQRNVWLLSQPMLQLRSDLTPEQRAYVLRRLAGDVGPEGHA